MMADVKVEQFDDAAACEARLVQARIDHEALIVIRITLRGTQWYYGIRPNGDRKIWDQTDAPTAALILARARAWVLAGCRPIVHHETLAKLRQALTAARMAGCRFIDPNGGGEMNNSHYTEQLIEATRIYREDWIIRPLEQAIAEIEQTVKVERW